MISGKESDSVFSKYPHPQCLLLAFRRVTWHGQANWIEIRRTNKGSSNFMKKKTWKCVNKPGKNEAGSWARSSICLLLQHLFPNFAQLFLAGQHRITQPRRSPTCSVHSSRSSVIIAYRRCVCIFIIPSRPPFDLLLSLCVCARFSEKENIGIKARLPPNKFAGEWTIIHCWLIKAVRVPSAQWGCVRAEAA